jgi:hypothetical protein
LILSRRLINSGCLKALNRQEKGQMKIKKGKRGESDDEGEDY